MKIRTQLKAAGVRLSNHNESLHVRTGVQGGRKRDRLVVRAGLRAGARIR
jgi:hypothetical protein